ncbi:MAG: ImmA/IrrE family metallo-endopeptidase, partial [Calditrichaeota bacterium]|nr:ImmA/IrrE family metallo-endopeptidase [Calditrichota bacterium]
LAALRSYQQMNQNYFGDIEDAAEGFLREMRWSPEPPLDSALIANFLQEKFHYRFDEETLSGYPELEDARSVLVEGAAPRLLIRKDLQPEQKKFILAREIGYRHLNLKERSLSSAWMNVASFDQIVNDFKASYFAGALLMNRELLCRDLTQFLRRPRWDGAALLEMIERYQVSPEMFPYRASELLPHFFGLKYFMFFRFSNGRGTHF